MKLLLFSALLFMGTLLQPAFALTTLPAPNHIVALPATAPAKMTIKEWEKATGKKLPLLQRLTWKLAQKRMSKPGNENVTEKQRKLGRLSMIFGIAGLVLLFLPNILAIAGIGLGIAAFILGLKSVKGNSNTPGIVGLIAGSLTLLLTVLAVAIAAAFIAGW